MDTSWFQRLFSQFHIELFEKFAVLAWKSGLASVSGVLDVILEKVDVNWGGSTVRLFKCLHSVNLVSVDLVDLEELLIGGMILDVGVNDEGA